MAFILEQQQTVIRSMGEAFIDLYICITQTQKFAKINISINYTFFSIIIISVTWKN